MRVGLCRCHFIASCLYFNSSYFSALPIAFPRRCDSWHVCPSASVYVPVPNIASTRGSTVSSVTARMKPAFFSRSILATLISPEYHHLVEHFYPEQLQSMPYPLHCSTIRVPGTLSHPVLNHILRLGPWGQDLCWSVKMSKVMVLGLVAYASGSPFSAAGAALSFADPT